MANNFILSVPRRTSNVILNYVQRNNVVNVPPSATGKRRFRLPVETDPEKLVNYCCGLNYHIDEPLIPLKPDNEYPDWLWELRTGPQPNSWEMEKGTKEYYLQLAREGVSRNIMLKKTAENVKKPTGKLLLQRAELKHRLRFAALAHTEDDDVGFSSSLAREEFLDKTQWRTRASDYYLPYDETRELFMDKIDTGLYRKALWYHDRDSTFKQVNFGVKKPEPVMRKRIQDSKRRHQYSVY